MKRKTRLQALLILVGLALAFYTISSSCHESRRAPFLNQPVSRCPYSVPKTERVSYYWNNLSSYRAFECKTNEADFVEWTKRQGFEVVPIVKGVSVRRLESMREPDSFENHIFIENGIESFTRFENGHRQIVYDRDTSMCYYFVSLR